MEDGSNTAQRTEESKPLAHDTHALYRQGRSYDSGSAALLWQLAGVLRSRSGDRSAGPFLLSNTHTHTHRGMAALSIMMHWQHAAH